MNQEIEERADATGYYNDDVALHKLPNINRRGKAEVFVFAFVRSGCNSIPSDIHCSPEHGHAHQKLPWPAKLPECRLPRRRTRSGRKREHRKDYRGGSLLVAGIL